MSSAAFAAPLGVPPAPRAAPSHPAVDPVRASPAARLDNSPATLRQRRPVSLAALSLGHASGGGGGGNSAAYVLPASYAPPSLASGSPPPPPPPSPRDSRPDRPDRPGRPSDAWHAYVAALASAPVRTKAATAAVLNALADILAQALSRGSGGGSLDADRVLRFALFGGALAGPAGHLWFGLLDGAILTPGVRGVVMKVVLDQLCFAPILLSAFYASMAVMEGERASGALDRVRDLMPASLTTGWKVWPAINMINFGLVPAPYRVLFVNGVSLFWMTFLSLKSS